MRPRTPSILWIPFVFSIGTISWALLIAGLVILAAVVITPAYKDVNDIKVTRNDYQATIDLLDQKIALQKDVIVAANTEPEVMERLAARQLNIFRKDQEFLPLKSSADAAHKDHSVASLIAESLKPVEPAPVKPIAIPGIPFSEHLLATTLNPITRPTLIILACAALALSFFLGIKYERR